MPYTPYATSGVHNTGQTLRPFWSIDLNDNEQIKDWFRSASENTEGPHRTLVEADLRRRDFYMGIQSVGVGKEGIPRDKEGKPIEKFARVTINQCYELVEQWVSKMTRFAPAIAVIPPNQEYNDRVAAKLSKEFIDYLFYVSEIDDVLENAARACRIDGEVFVFVLYDKSKGDLNPAVKEALGEAANLGIRIPLVNAQGEQVYGEDREPLYIEKAERTGDVSYEIAYKRFVILQPKAHYSEVEWAIRITSKPLDELRAQYPDVEEELSQKAANTSFSGIFQADEKLDEVLVYELFHRGTEFLDSGYYVKMTGDVVLEKSTAKEKWGHLEFPFARLTNVDIPGVLRGCSFLDQILLLQVMYNNLASIAYTNMALGSHIYWMVPRAAQVDFKKLKNGASVIDFSGAQEPSIKQFSTAGPELFQALEFVNTSIQRISAIQGVSRGEPPTGIEAGVALAFLEEQENQRANTDIKKHNAFIKRIARLSLATAGAFYRAEDGRTIRIVGKNNQFSIKTLEVAKLGGPYDIRVQRTTALSESKSGRISQILALEGRFQGLFPREQIIDMLDLANDQKLYNLGAVAVEAAERENELMAEGAKVKDAEAYEEHLQHLYSMRKYMQSASFKEDMPEDRKRLFYVHGMSHEYFVLRDPVLTLKARQMFEAFPVFSLPGMIGVSPESPLVPMGAPQEGLPPDSAPVNEADAPEDTQTGEPPSVGPETPQAPTPPTEQPEPLPVG